jgi:hypothetical protein
VSGESRAAQFVIPSLIVVAVVFGVALLFYIALFGVQPG